MCAIARRTAFAKTRSIERDHEVGNALAECVRLIRQVTEAQSEGCDRFFL
jgi:hypothetical protein